MTEKTCLNLYKYAPDYRKTQSSERLHITVTVNKLNVNGRRTVHRLLKPTVLVSNEQTSHQHFTWKIKHDIQPGQH